MNDDKSPKEEEGGSVVCSSSLNDMYLLEFMTYITDSILKTLYYEKKWHDMVLEVAQLTDEKIQHECTLSTSSQLRSYYLINPVSQWGFIDLAECIFFLFEKMKNVLEEEKEWVKSDLAKIILFLGLNFVNIQLMINGLLESKFLQYLPSSLTNLVKGLDYYYDSSQLHQRHSNDYCVFYSVIYEMWIDWQYQLKKEDLRTLNERLKAFNCKSYDGTAIHPLIFSMYIVYNQGNKKFDPFYIHIKEYSTRMNRSRNEVIIREENIKKRPKWTPKPKVEEKERKKEEEMEETLSLVIEKFGDINIEEGEENQ